GLARVPVADYEAAYADETESLKGFDRSLFGGSAAQVPDAYRRSSPLSYVGEVRAPVLILAGAYGARCQLRQLANSVRIPRELGGSAQLVTYESRHFSIVKDERVRQMRHAHSFAACSPGSSPGTGPRCANAPPRGDTPCGSSAPG